MRKHACLVALLFAVTPVYLLGQETPCKSTVTGHLEIFSLVSATFHNTRNLRVWLPPGYGDPANVTKKYPVLYILDGKSAFDACTALLHDEMRAGAAALYIALQRPELFDRMIIESLSMQVGNGQLLRDSVSLTSAPHRIALGIGTAEALESQFRDASMLNAAWVRMMHSLAGNLKAAAYTSPQVQLTVAEGAHHTAEEFGKRFAAGLLFIYAPTPVKTTPGR